MMDYAIEIPTRGRNVVLAICIRHLLEQTHLPSLFVIIDNNEEKGTINIGGAFVKSKIPYIIKRSEYGTTPSAGHQQGLDIIRDLAYTVAVRWDDDLFPMPDCLEKIVKLVHDGKAAAGGMYPRPEMKDGPFIKQNIIPDGNERHLQFFKWGEDHKLIPRHFLYSSFAYNVRLASAIDGFEVRYSELGHREETDFSLRLNKKFGPLVVDTSAVAYHHVCGGGTRTEIDFQKRGKMIEQDELLFATRMKEFGIDPNY